MAEEASQDLRPSAHGLAGAHYVSEHCTADKETAMIEQVVVPVDFTRQSDRAAMVAPVLAEWAGAGIELLAVTPSDDRVQVEERLANLADEMGGGTTWRIVESGGPLEPALLTEMHRRERTLWCVGSHARSAFGELLLRSVSEQLVRDAHLPIVLVGPHVQSAPRGKVLAVALDGTPASEAILPVASDMAGALGVTLRLLQVGSPGYVVRGDASETAYLSSTAAKVPTIERQAVDYDVLHDRHPGHALADYIAAYPEIGMVAMATRGLSGAQRFTHGSTAFELAHRATIPVLVLHRS
jgi:nucleotide-binding universal stress UspA family protein